MRVSGRKLRLAVGSGVAALMLTLGVASVGATAPGAVGNIGPVVTGGGASALDSSNTTQTAATYRNAPVVTKGSLGGGKDDCEYIMVGNNVNANTVRAVDRDGCGELVLRAAAYPLWEVQSGTPGKNVLVVPPTENPRNGTTPAKEYVIETFR